MHREAVKVAGSIVAWALRLPATAAHSQTFLGLRVLNARFFVNVNCFCIFNFLLLYLSVLRQSQVEAHENLLLLLPLCDFISIALHCYCFILDNLCFCFTLWLFYISAKQFCKKLSDFVTFTALTFEVVTYINAYPSKKRTCFIPLYCRK